MVLSDWKSRTHKATRLLAACTMALVVVAMLAAGCGDSGDPDANATNAASDPAADDGSTGADESKTSESLAPTTISTPTTTEPTDEVVTGPDDPAIGATPSDELELSQGETEPEEPDDIASTMVFPDADWETVTPEEAGFDGEVLAGLATAAQEIDSSCVAVTRNGRLVYEWHAEPEGVDREVEVFSATKSMTSTLVGMAVEQGLLDIDDRASDYITEWRDTPAEDITIRNLLANDSGRYWDFETDYFSLNLSDNRTGFAIDLDQQHEPGEEWVYNNAAIQTLEQVLEVAAGTDDVAAWGEEQLLTPIGMTNSSWTTDADGNALTFMGVQSNCRDLARFGTLFLANGSWDGEQLVSPEWVAESTEPSQELNRRYGFLWWLNTPSDIDPDSDIEPNYGDNQLVPWPDVSVDTYAAQGLGGQLVQVQPDTGIVLTRMGSVNSGNSPGAMSALNPTLMEAFSG